MVDQVRIAYAGEPGAFAEDALIAFFGADAARLAVGSFAEVRSAILDGRAAFGVLPIENLVNGTVRETLDLVRDGVYVTLRITAGMYHRFHAPSDLHVTRTVYVSGDTWNVNPIAQKRVERLFCRNERAVVQTRLPDGAPLVMVPVAAILVASIRLHFLDTLLHLRYQGPNQIECNATYKRGEEMGWFEHGSTIIVFAPKGYAVCAENQPGAALRMGQPLMRRVE